jgi:uncharacterized protein (TIGR00369 family)
VTPADASPVDDGACFACGPHNPDGLGLHFARDGSDGARARLTLDRKYQGYRGIAHGGIVMLLLDEAMAHASGAAGERVMTAAVNARFRAPVPLGVPLQLVGRVLSKRGKILRVHAALLDAAGAALATAEGSFVSLGPIEAGQLARLVDPGEAESPSANTIESADSDCASQARGNSVSLPAV